MCCFSLSSQCAHFTEEESEACRHKVTPKDTSWKGAGVGGTQVSDPEPALLSSQAPGRILKGTRGIPKSPILYSEPHGMSPG